MTDSIDPVTVGRRVCVGMYTGVARYVGPIPGTEPVVWVGVEWDDPLRGKHNGLHDGTRYFKTVYVPTGSTYLIHESHFKHRNNYVIQIIIQVLFALDTQMGHHLYGWKKLFLATSVL